MKAPHVDFLKGSRYLVFVNNNSEAPKEEKIPTVTIALVFSGLLGGAVIANEIKLNAPETHATLQQKPSTTPASEIRDRDFESTLSLRKEGRKVSFNVEATSLKNRNPVANRVVLEVMDDRGAYVVPPFFSSDENLEKKDSSRTEVMTLNKILTDGYYSAVAKSFFASSESFVGMHESVVFFVSIDGEISEVSRKEWNENSLTNVAFQNVVGGKP